MSVVRMLRATLVGRVADSEAVLTAVQRAGLLHIEPIAPIAALSELPTSAGGDPLAESARISRARAAIFAVPAHDPAPDAPALPELLERVEALLRRREVAQARAGALDACLAALEPFGDFAPEDVEALERAGVPILFVRLTRNDWHGLDLAKVPHAVTAQSEEEIHAVLFGPEAEALPLTPLRLPPLRLDAARAEREALAAELRDIERALGALQPRLPELEARLEALADRAAVLRARAEGMADGPVFAVAGYLPAEAQADLQRAVGDYAVALEFDDPAPGEAVPVKLAQPPLLDGFTAVVRAFSGISYWEKDFTPVVGLLFLVFGALCLLDGGYGVLLLLTGLLLRRRGERAFGSVFALTGAATALLGLLSGQFFGLVVGQNGFMTGHQPILDLASNPMSSFIFSLVVGLAGMTLSYLTAIWQRGWRTAATGSLLVALAAVALTLAETSAAAIAGALPAVSEALVGDSLSWLGWGLLVAGLAAWIRYPDDVFGAEKHGANAAWTLYAGLTGLGQDVMSHMRLFGIALSGSIMAMVVNQIAGLFPLPVTIVFAVVGHVFVFLLSLLSLYIHTNRLIFLEFGSKCFDGGQHWYAPMRSREAERQGAAA